MKNKYLVNILVVGLMNTICMGGGVIENMCIEYSGCLTREDNAEVKQFLSKLIKEDRNSPENFVKYLISDLLNENGSYDKEVLFAFINDYTRGKYDKNTMSSLGTFSVSFEKMYDNGCGEYVYRYYSPSYEGEYSTWLMIGRDPSDGMIKIMMLGLAG